MTAPNEKEIALVTTANIKPPPQKIRESKNTLLYFSPVNIWENRDVIGLLFNQHHTLKQGKPF